MESQTIDLIKTSKEIFEFQPDNHKKDSENSQIMRAKLLHPTIDFKPEGMVVGFSTLVEGDDGPEEQAFHLLYDVHGFRIEATNHIIFLGKQKYLLMDTISPPLVDDKWNLDKMVDYLKQPIYPGDIFKTIKFTIQKYCELENETQYGLIAAWVVATYFAHLFPAFPFLLFIGHKETGKSKVLEIINHLAFNSVKVKTIMSVRKSCLIAARIFVRILNFLSRFILEPKSNFTAILIKCQPCLLTVSHFRCAIIQAGNIL